MAISCGETILEIRSLLWQRIFACLFLILFPSLPFISTVTYVHNLTDPMHSLIPFVATLCISLYVWRSTYCFILGVDEHGIYQRNGFRNIYVAWSDIDSYRMEPLRNSKSGLVEPVLIDKHDVVIFRPFAHVLDMTPAMVKQRKEFWGVVLNRLHEAGCSEQPGN